jgi:hypothetical protein
MMGAFMRRPKTLMAQPKVVKGRSTKKLGLERGAPQDYFIRNLAVT